MREEATEADPDASGSPPVQDVYHARNGDDGNE
jgi:hypothetical protein